MARELNVGWGIAINTSRYGIWRRNWWCGPYIGWTDIPESAVVYTTRTIAEQAAALVYARLKKDWPNHMQPVVVKFPHVKGPM